MNANRVRSIDSLRGFSLVGILLANMLAFQYGIYGSTYLSFSSTWEQGIYESLQILVVGSFLPIFTILFGFSLTKLMESKNNKGLKSRGVIIRRAIGLLIIGYLHSTYLWDGDILTFYGSLTFLLLIFLKRKAKTLFIWSAIMFSLLATLSLIPSEPLPITEDSIAFTELEQETLTNGTYSEINFFRNNIFPSEYSNPSISIVNLIITPFIYFSLFLFGMGLAKSRFFEKNNTKKLKVGLILIPIGITVKTIGVLNPFYEMLHVTGGQILAVGYICAYMLFITKLKINFVFEQVGQLSLTNYLMQSVICTTIFYGYGLGLFGSLGVTFGIILGIFIYAAQCFISCWYLNRFERGPIEAILRNWSYFQWLKIFKRVNEKH